MECRFIDTGFRNAYKNMAIDEALASKCTTPILRFYQWKPSAVSIGYNQNLEREINVDYCKKNGIDIVRRITGGKAVFHDKEITYSFIVPEKLGLLPMDVVESYRMIAEALVMALKKIKIDADIKKVNERIATPICFNSSNWYELMVNDKKISGSAQRRIDGVVLQHGPILIDFDYEENSRIFKSKGEIDSIKNLKQRITSIKNELGKSIEIGKLKSSIREGFAERFGLELKDSKLSDEEEALAKSLLREYSAD